MKYRRLFFLLLLILPLTGFSQGKTAVTLKENNITLRQLFDLIQQKTEYRFFYNEDLPALNDKVSVDARNEEVTQLLKTVIDPRGLIYRIVDDKLIVVADPKGFRKHGVSGVVVADDGTPLPGVNVIIKGTSKGTITDMDGHYSLEVPDGSTVLMFSFVGYEPQEIPVGDRKVIDVVLKESVQKIEKVVVTGLGISRKQKSLGYAVTEVGGDAVSEAKEANMINSLAGKVAGLQINRTAGGVGSSSRVILRGITSLLGSNRPLFVVDGVPVSSGNLGSAGEWGGRDMGDNIADINPEDIESISVLKGPSASAIYGSIGANGVILITTKSGKKKEGVGIEISSSASMETPLVLPKLQNKYGMGGYGVYAPIDPMTGLPSGDYPWVWSYGPEMKGQLLTNWLGEQQPYTAQPDNYKDYFATGWGLTNTIAFDAGNEKATTRVSVTDFRTQGIVPNNDLNRQTFNLRGTSKLGKRLDLDARITYVHQRAHNRPLLSEDSHNPVYMLEMFPRNLRLEDVKNNIVDENGVEKNWMTDIFTGNPYWAMKYIGNIDDKNRVISFMSLNYHFTDWLNLMVRTGVDYFAIRAKSWQANNSKTNRDGYMNGSQSNSTSVNSDFLLSGKKDVMKGLNIGLSLGGNLRYSNGAYIGQYGSQFNVPDFYNISNVNRYSTSEGFSEKEVYSLYGLANIAWKDYLFLDATVRNDWSTTLPKDNNSYFYHSENVGFIFTEAFHLKNYWFSFGKLRGSFARVGNDTGPYQTYQYYYIEQSKFPYPLGNLSSQLAFFDFKPEITNSWETGADLMFFNRRIEANFTYYENVSKNQIMSVPLSHSTGYTSKRFNAGSIKSTGYELTFGGTPVHTDTGFDLHLSFNLSHSSSVVQSLHPSLDKLELAHLWSASIQARPGEKYGDIYGYGYKKDKFGRKLIDERGFAQKGEYTNLGNINPDFLAGFSGKMSWKGLSLSFLVDIQKGGKFFSWGKAIKSLFGNLEETLEGRAEWYATHDESTMYQTPLPGVKPDGYYEDGVLEKNGQTNDIPIQPIWRWYNIYAQDIAEEWIVDATNVRMREMVLGYSFPRKMLQKTPFSFLNLSLSGRNLFFFYKVSQHVDPESGYNPGNVGNGFENHALPTTRSIAFNLKIGF
jgi:TonB-linked SusC/RagA family outer membrane protein